MGFANGLLTLPMQLLCWHLGRLHRRVKLCCCGFLDTGEAVAIEIQGYGDGRMAEAFCHCFRVYPLLQIKAGHCMPQVMQADALKPNPPGQPPEGQS